MSGWFAVDREGLAKILERRGKTAALYELVQNAWDEEGVTACAVTLEPIPGRALARFKVEDDAPDGFADLAYAYTFFKASGKVHDPEKRGRFSIGEKLVLGLCTSATVSSTRGTVEFAVDGQRHERPRLKREAGSVIEGILRMTRDELDEALVNLGRLIAPAGIATTINGEPLPERYPVADTEVRLPTEVADEEGYLRPRIRQTIVAVYEPQDGRPGTLYEMGIPVTDTGDRWDVDVRQKVPVSLDRQAIVSASYLRDVRAAVLNAMADRLEIEDASEGWVNDALEDPETTAEAVERVLDLRYGEKRVVYDPSDHEANRIAASKGYNVIHGGSLPREAWQRVREAGAALPAGQVTPSPKPFHPDGDPLVTVPEDEWTDAERNLAEYARALHKRISGRTLNVVLARDPGWGFRGAYGADEPRLTINLARLHGRGPGRNVDEFLIHEFAHYAGGHLDAAFDDALAEIGATMVAIARQDPAFYDRFDLGPETL